MPGTRFSYEDYGEHRVFVNKFDFVFTVFHNKWKIGGRLFKELSRIIEWCKAVSSYATSMSIYALR